MKLDIKQSSKGGSDYTTATARYKVEADTARARVNKP